MIKDRLKRLLNSDFLLKSYKKILKHRIASIHAKETVLTQGKMSLGEFANGHEYFGLHFRNNEWIFREWAPHASAIGLIGNMTDWQEKKKFALDRINAEGVWQIRLPSDSLSHGDLYRLHIRWPGGEGDRLPVYARRVVQDPNTLMRRSGIPLRLINGNARIFIALRFLYLFTKPTLEWPRRMRKSVLFANLPQRRYPVLPRVDITPYS